MYKWLPIPQIQLNTIEFAIGEVQYYFRLNLSDRQLALAMISRYGPPNRALLKISSGALYSCRFLGNENLIVVNAKSIQSVVGMVKHKVGEYNSPLSQNYGDLNLPPDFGDNTYYLVEKIGLEVLQMTDYVDEEED